MKGLVGGSSLWDQAAALWLQVNPRSVDFTVCVHMKLNLPSPSGLLCFAAFA